MIEKTRQDEHSGSPACYVAEAEYVELNMSNYDEEDVSQLNDWAIAAFSAIESITGEAAFSGLPESKQEELLRLIGEV